MEKINAVFLTNASLLSSPITGGVQLCSQEFHEILGNIDNLILSDYYVPYTKNLIQRARIYIGMENYSVFDVARDSPALIDYLKANKIGIVFINMASLVRYAKPIRNTFGGNIKIVLLSHGNNSGDFLHLITKPVKQQTTLRKFINKIRLGKLLATESEYRVRWLDGVVTLSETEKQIENWFGAKKASFLPRRLYANFLARVPVISRIGFVGRLDHPPNLQGITIFLDELAKHSHKLKFRLVGAPQEYGSRIREQFPFVEYLGEVSDQDLEKEAATWAFFINPVWWYSTGASTKLGKAISWGLPIITTTAGMRGYEWKSGNLLVADSPTEMVQLLIKEASTLERINYWREQTEIVAQHGPDKTELDNRIRYTYE